MQEKKEVQRQTQTVCERESQGLKKVWMRSHPPNTQDGHSPLAVQAISDFSLSATQLHTDSKDLRDYFPLATLHEKLWRFGHVGPLNNFDVDQILRRALHRTGITLLSQKRGKFHKLVSCLGSYLQCDGRETSPHAIPPWGDATNWTFQCQTQPKLLTLVISLFTRASTSCSEWHWFSIVCDRCNNQVLSRSYQCSAMLSYMWQVHMHKQWHGERKTKECVWDSELQSFCPEHGCISRGGYSTGTFRTI